MAQRGDGPILIRGLPLFQVLPDALDQQAGHGVHGSRDVRVEHVPAEMLGLLPGRGLLQETVRGRTRRRRRISGNPSFSIEFLVNSRVDSPARPRIALGVRKKKMPPAKQLPPPLLENPVSNRRPHKHDFEEHKFHLVPHDRREKIQTEK
ncbi:unnamed protein product [Nesidiocoris tenuis]|uniref:Uncharacterized protein n=1 Tax=Nesidiocoris tenuis TaxID=355587 RepID=A0A6H5FZH4_9HEMI|nr:unnamed protein product [Nesidiocoris tenuis]